MEVKMMKFMKTNRILKTPIIALFSSLFVAATLQAQTDQPKTEKRVDLASTPTPALTTFSIDFPGGTPEELVQRIAKESGTKPNVIIPDHAANVQLPKFKLENVNTPQVFEALNMVGDEKGAPQLRWNSQGTQGSPNPVWILYKMPARQTAETCQVTFIGNLLESFQLDDINAAIRTAWEMVGQPSSASLKFHKETKLLIAKGNDQELKLVQEVLKSLELASSLKKVSDPKKSQ